MPSSKKLVVLVTLLVGMAPACADIIVIKDGQGQQYQIDGNVKVENGVRISRIRWPDNQVNTIRVTTCEQGKGILYSYDASGKKFLNSAPWSARGQMLVDKVAVIVCKNSK